MVFLTFRKFDQMSDMKTLQDPKDLQDRVHELKTWKEFFSQVFYGSKKFEVRKDDRGFQEGDWLKLNEWDHKLEVYTGRFIYRQIGYILKGGQFGIKKGYVVMQLVERSFGPISIEVKY